MHAVCSTLLILLNLITLITFGEEYENGASHYGILSSHLLLPVSWTQIFSKLS
jgi:hypothetical protein